MISGNHDSDDRLNYAKQFFANRNIFISSVFNGNLDKYTVNDGANDVNIYLLPFIKASQVRHFYPDLDIESYEDAVKMAPHMAWDGRYPGRVQRISEGDKG